MRIRSTKPEFWRSKRVASVDWAARLVLKGLESYVDDNGVGKDDLALIVGDVFPRDMAANPRDTLARVSEALTHLSEAGLLHRYEADGTELLYVAFWEDIQRIDKPGKGRLRRPDGTTEYGESKIRESVASPRETLAPGTGEQGNRGTEEQARTPRRRASSPMPSDWSPNEAHKQAAHKKGIDVGVEAERFRNWSQAKDQRYVDWDAAFRNWLTNARVTPENTATPRPGRSVWDNVITEEGQ